ncbi:MAG: 50S ribosomal protein L11 methyltransferase [Actinomycetota bacterium]|nr:50S ribosomal protein L11 methyltransferase [Actinomycetota bacterium]
MIELFPHGFEERNEADGVELVAYTDAAGEERIWAAFGGAAGDDVEAGWEERWRAFHRPVEVGPLRVRPPWAEARDERDVVIDPGQAFGTGGHETTRLCLELLLEVPAEGSLVDLGCGSGVLAIAAARLGWSPVLALDFDPLAVEATAENARVNGVEVEARRFDLREGRVPAGRVVVANLLRPLLLDVARRGVEARTLIASGLLRHEADEVAAAFAAHDLVERRRAAQGDWAALLLS